MLYILLSFLVFSVSLEEVTYLHQSLYGKLCYLTKDHGQPSVMPVMDHKINSAGVSLRASHCPN